MRPEHKVEIKLTEALESAVALGNEVNRLKAAIDFLLQVVDTDELLGISYYVEGKFYPGPATAEVAAVIEEALARKPAP